MPHLSWCSLLQSFLLILRQVVETAISFWMHFILVVDHPNFAFLVKGSKDTMSCNFREFTTIKNLLKNFNAWRFRFVFAHASSMWISHVSFESNVIQSILIISFTFFSWPLTFKFLAQISDLENTQHSVFSKFTTIPLFVSQW